jgi:hypothetical protein
VLVLPNVDKNSSMKNYKGNVDHKQKMKMKKMFINFGGKSLRKNLLINPVTFDY